MYDLHSPMLLFIVSSYSHSPLTPPAPVILLFSPSKVWASTLELLLSFRSLPNILVFSFLGLRQMQQKMVKEISSTIHLATMEAAAEYCVKAQTYVETINRSSSFSQPQCVRAQGNSRPSCIYQSCSHAH